jgi:ribosomal protein S1
MTSESVWDEFVARHGVGDSVAVMVTKTLPFGCLVEVPGGVPGLLKGGSGMKPGERLEVRIDTIDTELRRISVVSA